MPTENDHADLKESLRRCSPATLAAAVLFREQGDLDAVPQVVFGAIERYQPATATVKLSQATDETRLAEDLGLDSLTLLEVVMSIEETLRVRIENDELREIRTFGRLNQFLRAKISGAKTAGPGRRYSREEIALVLPQQPPFLFLDSAELDGAVVRGRYTVKGDEYFLEGHFKNEPVLPASIVFEAMGQTACLWVLEQAPKQLRKEIKSNKVFFAALDGAHFSRKALPGDALEFELKLSKLREPLAVFEGAVTCRGERVARVERLVLAFGDGPKPAKTADTVAELAPRAVMPEPAPAVVRSGNGNGHH